MRAIAEGTGGNYYGPRFEEVDKIASRIMQGMEFGKLSTTFKLETEFYPLLFLIALLTFSVEFLFGRWEYLVRSVLLVGVLAANQTSAIDSEVERKLGQDPRRRPYNAYNQGIALEKAGVFLKRPNCLLRVRSRPKTQTCASVRCTIWATRW